MQAVRLATTRVTGPAASHASLVRRLCIVYAFNVLDDGRACLITLHSKFEIFLKGHPAVEVMLDRRIFER